ncbi:hypothetical protein RSW31_25715, partial [Escherichia coli]|uniref:ABC transporter permease subunit n=1 Tax=Escherichia coli TaxID=562 RepID=UPI0028DF2390|nr:hypothetical protein [Escherichia coli]
GNKGAARRSGINVKRIYLSAFMLCSTLAALGGVLSAARLASSSQQAGTGDVNLNAITDTTQARTVERVQTLVAVGLVHTRDG